MNEFDEYKDKGITGLANIGNTCFINSSVQCISHTYELNKLLDRDNSIFWKKNNDKDTLICKEWNGLRKIMWSENCTISPKRFVISVHNVARIKKREIFTGFAQNDLPEFLLFLIDEFHNSLKRGVNVKIDGNVKTDKDSLAKKCFKMIEDMYSKEYSEIIDLFYGTHVSQIKDLSGNILVQTPEPFFMLNLPIPPNMSIKKDGEKKDNPINIIDCFDLYTKDELMNGDNMWYNEKIEKKQEAMKGILFFSLPKILVVDLKRFNNMNRKNNTFVDFPLDNLDLSKYIIGYNDKSYIYECYGICNHMGSSMGGHYTAFVKNANGFWYHFNDSNVSKIERKDENKMKSSHAYCLFFRKKINA